MVFNYQFIIYYKEEFVIYLDLSYHLMYYMTKVEKKVEIRYKEKTFLWWLVIVNRNPNLIKLFYDFVKNRDREMKWNEMKWNEMKWNDMIWNDMIWNALNY